MKKKNLKKIKLRKTTISNLKQVLGGIARGSGVSECHTGSGNDCCAMK